MKVLMSGNEAAGEGAIAAGCRHYFGYPITPQNELTAYMSKRMEELDGVFVQAESELAAINMVFGSALAGKRVMTSSSSPGISLKQEGISYMAGCRLPGVIVNVQRGGPGLGNIAPSQSDYYQATRGGGHGDYRTPVLAPESVQEVYDLMIDAFDLADRYRTPVLVLMDGRIGQMMEPLELREAKKVELPPKDWALTGCEGRDPQRINSLYLKEGMLEELNMVLAGVYREIERNEQRSLTFEMDDAEICIVAYGTSARVSREAIRIMRADGGKVGLFRPVSLWPFPVKALDEIVERVRAFVVVEMSLGQMIDDIRLVVEGRKPVGFCGRTGGGVPSTDEIIAEVKKYL
jgi:2-oxoglutarate ferredoxin oxidoreductase subunit alpha